MPVSTERIVELRFDDEGQGSGFIVTGRHVFTSSHLSKAATTPGARCDIRRMPAAPTTWGRRAAPPTETVLSGTVAWVDEELDVTVIRLAAPAGDRIAPVECVSVKDIRPLNCFFTGFPEASDRDSRTVTGTLTLEPVACRFDLDYHSASPLDERQWAGVSGAMVFHGDCAVGVVRTVSLAWRGKFTATPLEAVLRDPGFRAYWQQHGDATIAISDPARPPEPAPGSTERSMAELLAWCDRTPEYRALYSLTTPAPVPPGRCPGVRLFGLAGHNDHQALRIVQRLVDELRDMGRRVKYIRLARHTDFDKVKDLDTEVMVSLCKSDLSGANNSAAAMARGAHAEGWESIIVSFPVNCADLGRKKTQHRLAVAADWIRQLEGVPCPVVVAVILRWGPVKPPPLLARVFARTNGPEDEVAAAWQAHEAMCATTGPQQAGALCLLDGYEMNDLQCWIEKDNVREALADCVDTINARINAWYSARSRINFTELNCMLSTIRA